MLPLKSSCEKNEVDAELCVSDPNVTETESVHFKHSPLSLTIWIHTFMSILLISISLGGGRFYLRKRLLLLFILHPLLPTATANLKGVGEEQERDGEGKRVD